MVRRSLTSLALLAFGSGLAVAQSDTIARESVGERLAELRAMELKPFDAGLWSGLKDWRGEPLTVESTAGKVVLIATWASWNPVAMRAVPQLQKLHEQHAAQGLIVVGVHHPRGFEGAAAVADERGITFPIAHDADGSFRGALKVDQDPDIYFIDRAGQLRMADVRTDAAEQAVGMLLRETPDGAAGVQGRLDDARAEAEREFRRVREVEPTTPLDALPEVPFIPPGDEAYAALEWPRSVEAEKDNRTGDNEISTTKLSLRDEGWVGARPAMTGRVIVVYHWHPDIRPSHSPFQYEIDELARKRGRDVAVIGALSTPDAGVASSWTDKQKADYRDQERLTKLMREYHESRRVQHAFYGDFNNSVWGNYGDQRGSSGEVNFVPFAAIYSSDMRLRWYGYVGPLFRHTDQVAGRDAFLAALDRAIKIDPGVEARREAEQAYLRARGR